MRMFPLIAIIGLTMIAGDATARSDRNKVPTAVENGKAVSCLQLSSVRESAVRSDSVIDFRTGGKQWYRNTLPHSCPSLGFEQRYSHETSLNQICSVDIIYVLQDYGGHLQRGAGCGLGKFQPVELVKTASK